MQQSGGVTGTAGQSRWFCARCAGIVVLLYVLLWAGMGKASAMPQGDVDTSALPGCPNDCYWLQAKETVSKSVVSMLLQHQAELDRGIRYHKLMHGDRRQKYIALTFDDGPHPSFTLRLLALLKQYHVKATFFVVGEMAEKYPYLVKAEVADGHCIGNHTYHHVNLTKISPEQGAAEIAACNAVLKHITGHTPHLFRPPGGDYNHQVAEISEALHATMVLWSNDPGDYARPGAQVIERRLLTQPQVRGGAIILVHDGIEQTLDILPHLITTLRQQGYEFVTIDQMIALTNCHDATRSTAPQLATAPLLHSVAAQQNTRPGMVHQPAVGLGMGETSSK